MLILLAALFFFPLASRAADPTLEINAGRDKVYLGESFLMEVKVGGDEAPTPPDLSGLQNCTAELLGSQSASRYSIVIVNGRMTREGFTGRSFTYKLTPRTAGPLVLGPVTAIVAGKTLTATGPTVTVTGVTAQDLVLVSVKSSRDTVLVDEPFDIRLAIKIRRLPAPYADTDPLFPADPPHLEADFLNAQAVDGLKGPDFNRLLNERLVQRNLPGFSINNYTVQPDVFDFGAMMNPQGVPARFKLERQPATENGKAYWEYTLTVPYSPLSEGSYTFGPLLFKGNVPVQVGANGSASGTPVFAVGPAATVRVVPPPEADRPVSYIGAIGSNLTVEASLDSQTCNVGDPLTLTLSINGTVQMRNLFPPKLSLQTNLMSQFEVYDDTVQTLKSETGRQYAYTLRPRSAGSTELPPIEVSFYDSATRHYRTVTTRPLPLKVRQSAEITAAQVIGNTTNRTRQIHQEEEAAMRPAGIRMDSCLADPASLAGNARTIFLASGIGPAVFAVTGLILLVRRRRPALQTARRQRGAIGAAQRRLAALPPSGGPMAHRAVCEALRHYLADRFDVRTESLTPDDAERLLARQGIPIELARRFSDLMQHHFDASFGIRTDNGASPRVGRCPTTWDSRPSRAEEMRCQATALQTTTEPAAVLADIESHLAAPVGKRLASGILPLSLFLASALSVSAATPAERTFIRDEALAEISTARTPKEFLTAARTFQKLVDLGVKNAPLFYNQGTALMLAGRHADAVTVFQRAERYGGRQPDLARNLAIAKAREEGLKMPSISWSRTVLSWHYGLPCATRVMVAAIAFSGLWLAATLALLGRRRAGKTAAVICLLVLVFFGSSVAVTLQEEARPQRVGGESQISDLKSQISDSGF